MGEMKRSIRLTALAVLGAVVLSAAPFTAAEAGSKGKRNTAIGLGAVAVYGAVKKKPAVAGLAAGGAIYSYMRSREDAKKEKARRRVRYKRVYYWKNGKRYYRTVRAR
jgi:hypothetical protein